VNGDFSVDVKTSIPAAEFRFLSQLAKREKTTVGVLVAKAVHKQLTTKPVRPVVDVTTPDVSISRGRGGRIFGAEQVEALRSLYAEGYSDVQIARRLGYSVSTVHRRRSELGLPSTRPQYAPMRRAS
jgi:DNA invertase Pin-like site-specific DNA recombinase